VSHLQVLFFTNIDAPNAITFTNNCLHTRTHAVTMGRVTC